jgi:hypothetical protein
MPTRHYRNHLQSSDDLVTTYEATRAGFVALALEKNRRATPHVAEARALQEATSRARTPADLLTIKGIESGLLIPALSLQILPLLRIEATPKSVKLKFTFVLSLSKDEAIAEHVT